MLMIMTLMIVITNNNNGKNCRIDTDTNYKSYTLT